MNQRNGQKIGYIRVSSISQNTDRQLNGIELDKIFKDKCSGGKKDRSGLNQCMEYIRNGDTLIVHSIDRLCRNLTDLKNIVNKLNDKGIQVHFIKENLIFKGDNSPLDNLLLNVIGAVSEFEKALINERQREGIEQAKRRGVRLGRKQTLTDEQIIELKQMNVNKISKTEILKHFGISRPTVYRYLKL
jgi:DNA invertase Pin-like site-specific DNA recombinase